ncbi:MAG: PLP-dependent transferase, partial [Oligoflexia bacterium]
MKQKPPAGPSRSKLSAPQALAPETLAPETMMMRYGYNPWWSEGAVKPPLFLTSTFLFKSAEDGEEFFQVALGKKESTSTQGLIYSRLNNPELEILEERLKLWE